MPLSYPLTEAEHAVMDACRYREGGWYSTTIRTDVPRADQDEKAVNRILKTRSQRMTRAGMLNAFDAIF